GAGDETEVFHLRHSCFFFLFSTVFHLSSTVSLLRFHPPFLSVPLFFLSFLSLLIASPHTSPLLSSCYSFLFLFGFSLLFSILPLSHRFRHSSIHLQIP